MVRVNVVVREAGRLKPDYSLDFELPEVPKVGSYISIQRPDKPEPYGEDLIVRQVWWRLWHPETSAVVTGPGKVGKTHGDFCRMRSRNRTLLQRSLERRSQTRSQKGRR
jgi:hypothetical protein